MSLVALLSSAQPFFLAGGSPFGTPFPVNLSPGSYELRVVSGNVAIRPAAGPMLDRDVVVIPAAPMRVYLSGSVTFAAKGSTDALLWITRLIEG